MRSPASPLLTVGVIVALGVLVALAIPTAWRSSTGPSTLAIGATTPADGAQLPQRPLTISAEITSEQPLARLSLRLNDMEVATTRERLDARRWKVSHAVSDPTTIATTPAGDLRLALLARDIHGQQVTRAWRARLDPSLSIPVISEIQPPDNGFAPAGGFRFSALLQGDAPIASARLEIDGQNTPVTLDATTGGRSVAVTRLDLRPGAYAAALTVTDRDGDRGVRRWRFTVPDPLELLAFEQTGKAIGGGFRRFWQEKGGLEIFGLPISDELRQGGATVQYFERARFEYQTSRDGLLSEVQLGLVGRDLRQPDPPRPQPTGGDGRYFGETGHTIAGPFRRFWEEKGGLAIFGLPISAETRDGSATVQYFERARFELPSGSSTVALGHLGRELYDRQTGSRP